MSEQNRYQIQISDASNPDEWFRSTVWSGGTWQKAAYNWLEDFWFNGWGSYQVISEQGSQDSRSGMMEIIQEQPSCFVQRHVKATLIEGY